MSDGWMRVLVEVMLLLHLVTAFPIITNPPAQMFEQLLGIPAGTWYTSLQGDQLYMAVCFWNLVKSDLSIVYCTVLSRFTVDQNNMAMFNLSGCILKFEEKKNDTRMREKYSASDSIWYNLIFSFEFSAFMFLSGRIKCTYIKMSFKLHH